MKPMPKPELITLPDGRRAYPGSIGTPAQSPSKKTAADITTAIQEIQQSDSSPEEKLSAIEKLKNP